MSKYSEATLMDFAKGNKLARIVARPDACRFCKDFHGRIYRPSEAPEIPIKGCANPSCRCRYEPVDADTPETELLLMQGIDASKMGRREEASRLLRQLVELDDGNEQGWLWLSGCVDDLAERARCLEKVLAINPKNEPARAGLERLKEVLVEEKPPPEPPPAEAIEEVPEEEEKGEEELPPQESLPESRPSHPLSRLRSRPLEMPPAPPPRPTLEETALMPQPEWPPLKPPRVELPPQEISPSDETFAMPQVESEDWEREREETQAIIQPLPRLETIFAEPAPIPTEIPCPKCAALNALTEEKCTECGYTLLPGIRLEEKLAQIGCGCFFCFLTYLVATLTQTGAWTELEINLEVCFVSGFVFVIAALVAAFAIERRFPWEAIPLAERLRQRAEKYKNTDPILALADYTEALKLEPDAGPLYRARAEAFEMLGYKQNALADYRRYHDWAASQGRGDEADLAQMQIARLTRELEG
ncbi:MAG: hypothetical protein ACUVV0_03760 [Anaerolineae bacterium]